VKARIKVESGRTRHFLGIAMCVGGTLVRGSTSNR
jgi:hypothetical protein